MIVAAAGLRYVRLLPCSDARILTGAE